MRRYHIILLILIALIGFIFIPAGYAAPLIESDGTGTITQEYQSEWNNENTNSDAPASGAAETFPVTICDDAGNEVTIPAAPERIVSLSPSNTEILYALGLGDRIVAVTDHSDYPEEAGEKPSVGGFSSASIEKILAAQPDLVVTSRGNAAELKEKLNGAGLTVIELDPATIEDVLSDIVMVGRATGTAQNAEELISDMSGRLAAIKEKTEELSYVPTVAQVICVTPVYVSGRDTIQNEVVRAAGGTNVFEDQVEGWGILGTESIISAQPDYIIASSGSGMGTTGSDVIFDFFSSKPVFQQIPAVKNNHICVVNADLISRGGPRIIDAVEEVAGILHPTLFPEFAPVETATASGSQSAGMEPFIVPLSLLVIACCIRKIS